MIISPTEDNIRKAARLLREGGVVAFPTETVYGLGADALNAGAVAKVYSLKNRPAANPLIIHAASRERIMELVSPEAEGFMLDRLFRISALWPGPLSVILPKSDLIPDITSGSGKTAAFRIPNHRVALSLLNESGLVLAAPSANVSMYVSPTSAMHVEESFGSRIPAILDGGPCRIGIESTVLSLVERTPLILRPGSVTKNQIEEALGERVDFKESFKEAAHSSLPSPGMLKKHYSPRTPIMFLKDNPDTSRMRTGLIKFSAGSAPQAEDNFSHTICLSTSGDLDEVASGLFAAIREMDKKGLDLIAIDSCNEDHTIGSAIMDRLKRAVG